MFKKLWNYLSNDPLNDILSEIGHGMENIEWTFLSFNEKINQFDDITYHINLRLDQIEKKLNLTPPQYSKYTHPDPIRFDVRNPDFDPNTLINSTNYPPESPELPEIK